MRRRDLHHIQVPAGWLQKADDAKDKVDKGLKTPKELSRVWAELKPHLSQLSFGKCWYCESRQHRSDNAVDHFRPKDAYPWYAFSHKNYRFSCSFCNSPHKNPDTQISQGKSNLFPLFENSRPATSEEEIDAEQPILLDPCDAADVGLLDFLSDGTPCPSVDNPIFVRRVKELITTYHLDHPELIEQRRLLAIQLEDWIKRANAVYPRFEKFQDPIDKQAFGGFIQSIAKALDDRAELSAFARRVVAAHRAKPWVELILRQ